MIEDYIKLLQIGLIAIGFLASVSLILIANIFLFNHHNISYYKLNRNQRFKRASLVAVLPVFFILSEQIPGVAILMLSILIWFVFVLKEPQYGFKMSNSRQKD
ncbi:hypothetical protein ACFO4O_06495 [Glaciecola siphonariae]|uniref:Uncharacterized protein n=1 Tax=Glaciecola siphonariae TaxID=521012 RepID=A0ABV9LVB9_9ALTE